MRYTYYLIITLVGILFMQCGSSSPATTSNKSKSSKQKSALTIAFGSCNHQYDPQPIWPFIAKNKPDLWIWSGDIIYSDTEDMTKMKADYDQQASNPDYAAFAQSTKVLGIWDDHDYGINNGGKYYSKKDSSKILLFDFLGMSAQDSVHSHEGAYQAHLIKQGDLTIKILLLDVRYFRSEPNISNASILGNQQWGWLIRELQKNEADVHVIVSGTQILPEDHKFEMWANFGTDRMRLLQILGRMNVNNPILVSGDRHIAEMSLVELPQSGDPLLEITSSGLTHSYSDFTGEVNQHRVGEVYAGKNFGILEFEKGNDYVDFKAIIKSEKNKSIQSLNSYDLIDVIEQRKKNTSNKGG